MRSDGQRGRVILPRVWRRYDVVVPAQTVTFSTSTKTIQTVGDDALAAALDAAMTSVRADPERWHHLGSIESRERALGIRLCFSLNGHMRLPSPIGEELRLNLHRGQPESTS
jgi:hypothetical protein